MFGELQEKFRQWLQLTYSTSETFYTSHILTCWTATEELHQQPATSVSPGVLGIPRPLSVSPTPPSVLVRSSILPSPSTPVPPTLPPPETRPIPIGPATTPLDLSLTTLDVTNPGQDDHHTASPATTGPIGIVNHTTANLGVVTLANPRVTGPATIDPEVVNPTMVMRSVADSTTFHLGDTDLNMIGPDPEPSPLASDTPLPVVLSPNPATSSLTVTTTTPPLPNRDSPSQDQPNPNKPAPAKAYPKFITPEVLKHLSSITGVDGWSNLIQTYLEFEVASPSRSVSDGLFITPVH